MLMVDGRLAGEVVAAPGSHFEIGPYLFGVEDPPPGYDLALTYELSRPLPDGLAEIVANSRFTLAAGGVSKRALAWGALVVILVAFLALPVFNAINPALHAWTAKRKLAPDVVWNPGTLTSGHTSLARDCGACHRTPFVRVRDHECLACHRKMPGHIRDGMLQTRLFGDARCAQCHKDHRGTAPPIRTDAGLCVPCHADLRRAFPDTTLENAGDFAKSHPDFRLTLWRGPGMDDVVRVKQSDPAGRVEGTAFEVTDAEIRAADAYEVSAYARIAVTLASGARAWVYADARYAREG